MLRIYGKKKFRKYATPQFYRKYATTIDWLLTDYTDKFPLYYPHPIIYNIVKAPRAAGRSEGELKFTTPGGWTIVVAFTSRVKANKYLFRLYMDIVKLSWHT